ncbi:MAG: 2-dehydropantoate 2-reductase [Candidatus Omnitrophica bacterium]|nr:2-dehydropantoate 2-reductase [Candidatus Omnitrophota bacterium]
MTIVVVGAGAMGCLFSAFLSRSKEDIWLLDKDKDKAAKINENGISLEGASGTWQAKVKTTANIQDIGKSELILLCVKSFHTKSAVEQIKPLMGQNTRILTLQNGMGNIEVISELAGEERVIGGVTSEGATLLDAGKIRHAGRGETIIGMISGKTPVEMRSIREVFNKCGFETKMTRDIKALIWSKLIINAGINALTAITGLPNGKLTEFEGTKRILRDAVTEATRIAKRKRVKLLYDDPLAKVEAVCEGTAANLSSMLQDVLRKKRTEIDYINGVIVRLGQELGIPVPANKFLVDLVKTIESSYGSAAR